MSLYKLSKQEVKKIENEFKNTYLGKSIYTFYLAINLVAVSMIILDFSKSFYEYYNLFSTTNLLLATAVLVIIQFFYLIILERYYDKEYNNKKKD